PDVLSALSRTQWSRNNVRELRNVVERMILAAGNGPVGPEHLPSDLPISSAADPTVPSEEAVEPHRASENGGTLRERKLEAERRIVLEALEENEWQITRTAEALGLADHSSLLKIMRRHGLRR
ncbi:MAG: hypothetical protein KC729_13060, partial [Candidatus Eisenbacteria bacterium]|nr:hypothetical protein [Candidatus Eisenbacteria bacterium]